MDRDDRFRRYNRREWLKLLGLAAGAASLPSACRATTDHTVDSDSPATELPTTEAATTTAAATQAKTGQVSRVVLVRSDNRISGTQKALDLLQPEGIAGQTVFFKPNYNTADPAPASTDTALLEALVKEFQTAGARQMTIGDRSGMANTRQAMTAKGVFQLADKYGLKAIVFDELGKDDWQLFPAAGTHWSRGFAFARPILQAGAIINTCCLKTHRFGGHFTLSLKNTVGMVAKQVPGDDYNYMGELHSSPHQRLMIAEINKAYQPALVLLDGVEAFVNGGPDAGKTVPSNVILAGTDRVAVDVVAIGILRSLGTTANVAEGSVWNLDQIRRAVELGLGAQNDQQLEIVTGDRASQAMADQIRPLIRGA